MRTVFHHEAWEELVEAYESYHSESEGGARTFAGLMYQALEDIASQPFRFPVHTEGARRCLIRKFRHAIIFQVLPDHVFVIAIMHTSREPGYGSAASRKSDANGIESFCIVGGLN